jgi:hypothetical protein
MFWTLYIVLPLSKNTVLFTLQSTTLGTITVDWTQISRFYLKTETESSLRNGCNITGRWIMSRNNICTNVPSPLLWNRGTSVDTGTRPWNRSSNPSRSKRYFSSLYSQMDPEAHPTSYPLGTGAISSGRVAGAISCRGWDRAVPSLALMSLSGAK